MRRGGASPHRVHDHTLTCHTDNAAPVTADLGSVPVTADRGSVPATADLGSVPATADLGSVPATADLGSVPCVSAGCDDDSYGVGPDDLPRLWQVCTSRSNLRAGAAGWRAAWRRPAHQGLGRGHR